MKVYSLLGFVDYEGSDLLGVFGSLEDLMKYHKSLDKKYDSYGYYVSELGQGIHWEDVKSL